MSEEHPNAYTKWTDEEIDRLEKLYSKIKPVGTGKLTLKDLSEKFGRSVSSIRNKAYEEGFNNPNFWTEEEIEILKNHYAGVEKRDQLDLDSLAERLDKERSNICRKARELELTDKARGFSEDWKNEVSQIHKERQHTPPSLDENYQDKEWLREEFIGKDRPISEIAQDENVVKRTIEQWIRKLGLREEKIQKLGYANRVENGKGRDTGVDKKTYKCAHCGKEIERYPNQVNGEEIYCSLSCMASDRIQNRKESVYSDAHIGKREDLNNQFFRSGWEANYARYLNFVGERWEYEPKEFEFEEIKRGTRFYTPDFYLPDKDQFVEIKGWFRDKDKTKLKRFKKYYPKEFENLTIVIENKFNCKQAKTARELGIKDIQSYREIEDKVGGLIDNWE